MLNELKRKKRLSSLQEKTEQGIMLEDDYRSKLSDKIVGNKDIKKQLTNRIVGEEGSDRELGGLTKKPAYEELSKIPLNDQLKLMGKHFEGLKKNKSTKEEDEEEKRQRALDRLFPIGKGQVRS